MRGTFFQRPVEFKIQIDGESWNQGAPVAGTLVVKNHGNEPLALEGIHVDLAHAQLRKVRSKDAEAFDVLATAKLDAQAPLAQGQEATMDWSFQTDRNCPITDNTSSLFVVYGRGSTPDQLGQLQLNVQPFALIQDYLQEFTTQFRFILKSKKFTKNGVEAKLEPPDSKAFATLEGVSIFFRFDGESLETKWVFNVKGLEATAASVDTKKKKKDLTQVLTREQYLTSTGRVNHDKIVQAAKEALASVEAKISF